MILIDANLLLYAYDESSRHHAASRRWLEGVLGGRELVRFSWLTLWAFIRIATNPRILSHPFSGAEAHSIVTSWLDQPNVDVLEPGDRHLEILGALLRDGQATADLVPDAALAAVAIEHGATLCSTDRDFARFNELAWVNPIV